MWSCQLAVFSKQLIFTLAPPSWRPLTTHQPSSLPSRRRPVPHRAPTAPYVTTAQPANTMARRRATVVRGSSDDRCARAMSTRVASSAAASSTRTNATSVATADFASASGPACAKKVEKYCTLNSDVHC